MTARNANERRTLSELKKYAKTLIDEINETMGKEVLYYAETLIFYRLYVTRPIELRRGGSTTDLQVIGGRIDLEGLCRLCLRLEETKNKLITA